MLVFTGFRNDCARFRGHSLKIFPGDPADGICIHIRRFTQKNYFFLAAFFLAFFLAFAMRVLQLQVSPGTEYIHALPKYKQA
jgi:hypothetical protein